MILLGQFMLNLHFVLWKPRSESLSFNKTNHQQFSKWKILKERLNLQSLDNFTVCLNERVHGLHAAWTVQNWAVFKTRFKMQFSRRKRACKISKIACTISSNIHFSKFILNRLSIALVKDRFKGLSLTVGVQPTGSTVQGIPDKKSLKIWKVTWLMSGSRFHYQSQWYCLMRN